MEFAGTGAALIDIDAAIESCPLFIVLVDHDVFKSVHVDERADKHVYDTRGIWLDQPALVQNGSAYRIAVSGKLRLLSAIKPRRPSIRYKCTTADRRGLDSAAN